MLFFWSALLVKVENLTNNIKKIQIISLCDIQRIL